MYHLLMLKYMSYVDHYIQLTTQGNTSNIETIFLHSVCGRVVLAAGHEL